MSALRFKLLSVTCLHLQVILPQIFLCPYHPFFEVDRKGAIAFRDEHQDSKDTAYTFTPMKPQYWHSWTALAWEDM